MRIRAKQNNVRLLQGPDLLEQAPQLLRELAARSGQPEAIDDIRYYLEKPGLLRRKPVLALVYRLGAESDVRPQPEGSPVGAVLLFRYTLGRVSLKIFTSNDRSGRRSVIALPEHRLEVVRIVTDYLERRGAHIVMLSMRCISELSGPDRCSLEGTRHGSRIVRHRTAPDYLSLATTYEATLAGIGKRTRTHMRYYRKRAQELLGCTFDPELRIDRSGLLALNARCTHPLRKETVAWRLQSLSSFADPILVGLRDGNGELLGVLGGRRLGDQTEILWQMNRGDLPGHSLSLAIRCHLVEHEVRRGVRRLYLDGGTAHSLRNSFVNTTVTDVALLRRSALTYLLRKSARVLIPWDNELAHLLVALSGQNEGAEIADELVPLEKEPQKVTC